MATRRCKTCQVSLVGRHGCAKYCRPCYKKRDSEVKARWASEHKEEQRDSQKRWNTKHKNEPMVRLKRAVRYYTHHQIRNGKFKLADKCDKCSSVERLEIHHWRYRMPVRKEDVAMLCKNCHEEVHHDG